MKRYRGTCVGGIADGHYIERDDAKIKIDKRKTAGDGGGFDSVLGTTIYRFLVLLGIGNEEIGVWAPEGTPIEEVTRRLVQCYNPRTGLIGQPMPPALPIKTH